jgi:hypothetical protein
MLLLISSSAFLDKMCKGKEKGKKKDTRIKENRAEQWPQELLT